jgi:hypothetical protein
MVDLRSMTDDEVIALFEVARGYDRELMIAALGYTTGDAGVPLLRGALHQSGPGSTSIRTRASAALAERLGANAAPDLVPLLTGGNTQTQTVAVSCLEDVDDGRSSEAIVAWLHRRLHNKGRANTYAYYELSGVLRYAIRVGSIPRVLAVIEEDRGLLQREEIDLLDRAWPPDKRARYLATGLPSDGPDPSAVEDWYQMSVGVWTDEERLAITEESVGPAIAKLRKRCQRISKRSD